MNVRADKTRHHFIRQKTNYELHSFQLPYISSKTLKDKIKYKCSRSGDYILGKVTERRLELLGHVRRRPLEQACR